MRRLAAEEIRDSVLAVNGSLNLTMEGPSIYPLIPEEVLAGQSVPGQNWGDSSPTDLTRRSIYIHTKRSLIVPLIAAFDGADPDATCPVRFSTTQPTQALHTLNGEFMNRQARVLAGFVREGGWQRSGQPGSPGPQAGCCSDLRRDRRWDRGPGVDGVAAAEPPGRPGPGPGALLPGGAELERVHLLGLGPVNTT